MQLREAVPSGDRSKPFVAFASTNLHILANGFSQSHRSDLNRRPLDYESRALPLSYGGAVPNLPACCSTRYSTTPSEDRRRPRQPLTPYPPPATPRSLHTPPAVPSPAPPPGRTATSRGCWPAQNQGEP